MFTSTIVSLQAFFQTRLGQIVKGTIRVGIAAVVLLNLSIPGTLDQAKAEGFVAFAAFMGAVIAYLQHELIPWVLGITGTTTV